jgi:hypothetical protein
MKKASIFTRYSMIRRQQMTILKLIKKESPPTESEKKMTLKERKENEEKAREANNKRVKRAMSNHWLNG